MASFRIFSSKTKDNFLQAPFCGKNEKLSNTFIVKLNKFNNFNFIFVILWQTGQIKSLFNNKTKTVTDLKMFTKVTVLVAFITLARLRNLVVRTAEHSNPAQTSQPAKHITFVHLACSLLSKNIPWRGSWIFNGGG